MFFNLNYGKFCFWFLNDFFVLPIKLLLFFTLFVKPSSLFCRGSVISVSYSRLPQSYDQNKQGTLPCSRVSNKNKQEISFLSFSHFSLLVSSSPQIRPNRNQIHCEDLPNSNSFFYLIGECLRSASPQPFQFIIYSAILPSSSLTLPC